MGEEGPEKGGEVMKSRPAVEVLLRRRGMCAPTPTTPFGDIAASFRVSTEYFALPIYRISHRASSKLFRF